MQLGRNRERIVVGRMLWQKGYNKEPVTSHTDSKLPTYSIPYLEREQYAAIIMEHLDHVKHDVKGSTRFKKATLFRIYMSPIQQIGMYRYQKYCWTLDDCVKWYAETLTKYANKLKGKKVIP